MTAPTDEQLLARHLEGDESAFRQLVERHHRELFQFVFRFTHSTAAADDVVQDTFLQLHLAGQTFDPSRRLKPWLFTIAANKARDHLRSRTRRRELPLDASVGGEDDTDQSFLSLLGDGASEPSSELEEEEERELVRKVVDQMPANLAEALILAYFHKFPYKDIAEMLDIPLGTVKSRLHAAVAHFGSRYNDLKQAREKDGS